MEDCFYLSFPAWFIIEVYHLSNQLQDGSASEIRPAINCLIYYKEIEFLLNRDFANFVVVMMIEVLLKLSYLSAYSSRKECLLAKMAVHSSAWDPRGTEKFFSSWSRLTCGVFTFWCQRAPVVIPHWEVLVEIRGKRLEYLAQTHIIYTNNKVTIAPRRFLSYVPYGWLF